MPSPGSNTPCMSEAPPTRPSLGHVFGVFVRIGMTGFGGAMALLAMVQERAIERRKVATPEEFAEGVALGQLLPGPIVVDAVAYLGYRLRGVIGAVVAAGALILPAFLIMLVLTPLYLAYGAVPQVAGVFKGISGAVVAIILAAVWRMGQKSITDAKSALVAAVAMAALVFLGAPAWLIVLLAGALGILLFRPKAEVPK
jgi:chromate transporter